MAGTDGLSLIQWHLGDGGLRTNAAGKLFAPPGRPGMG